LQQLASYCRAIGTPAVHNHQDGASHNANGIGFGAVIVRRGIDNCY
jgi:hypothetical protein